MKVLYFDCFSGASGDMILGALIDAGASEDTVRAGLHSLGVAGWDLRTRPSVKSGVRALAVDVETLEDATSRTYPDIAGLIERTPLRPPVKDNATKAFRLLAEAEAKVHGARYDEVHFHEVGGTDAIVDVVGSMLALDALGADVIVTSPLPTGSGTVDSTHGPLPVPAPAVAEILKGAPLVGGGEGELVTPTGAAILTTVSDRFGEMPPMTLERIGYGAGRRDREVPNVLRVLFGEAATAHARQRASLLETNLDDVNPETVPYVLDALLAAGAQDAWITPIVMKKGRPALTLSVLADASTEDRILDVVFRETTTLGVRISSVAKEALVREWVETNIAGHVVRVKLGMRGSDVATIAPEYEDAVKAARATGLPLKDVYERALRKAREHLTRTGRPS